MAECSAVLPAAVEANSLSKIPKEISQRQTRVSETRTRYEPPSTALRRSASSTPTVPNQPTMLSTMGSIGGCLGSSRVPPRAKIPLTDGDFVGGEADLLQVARVTVGEEDVRSPQELVQLGTIVTDIGQVRRPHAYLCVPVKRLDLAVVGAPQVQDIGPERCQVSANRGAGDDMPH